MKNTDLTTIISGVLGVALIALAAVVLLYEPANIVFAGSLIIGALGLNGYNAALLAPSPKQGDQIAQAVAAAAPQVPLVNITHPASVGAAAIQVSSAAIPPPSQQGPQPIILPQPASQPMSSQPMNTAPQLGQVIPFPQGQRQGQDWRDWTGLTQVPPTQQQ